MKKAEVTGSQTRHWAWCRILAGKCGPAMPITSRDIWARKADLTHHAAGAGGRTFRSEDVDRDAVGWRPAAHENALRLGVPAHRSGLDPAVLKSRGVQHQT